MKNLKELTAKRVATPEETAAIVSASAIARGVDKAKTQIIGILGRARSFVRLHVAFTDVELGATTQERNGYQVTAIFSSHSTQVVEAVSAAVATWLKTCHGKRYEAAPVKPVVKAGSKTLYLAVSYAAVQAQKASN